MNDLSHPAKWSSIANVRFVMPALGDKIRLIAGLIINVVGAAMLLVYSVRLLGFTI